MTQSEFHKLFEQANPNGSQTETKLNILLPTYDNRTWQFVVESDNNTSIRLINDSEPDRIVLQEMYLTKEAFSQLYFILTTIVAEHVDIDEEYVTDWVASLDNIG